MKKDNTMYITKLSYVLTAIFCCGVLQSIDAHSKSFLMPRSVTTDSMFELSLVNYHRYHSGVDTDVQLYAKPFFMRSTNSSSLARYFLPNNKETIVLDEAGNGDVDPLWFSLISPEGTFYTSDVSLSPVRTVGGSLFTAYAFYNCWWFGLNTTLMNVRTNLNVQECNRTQDGTIPGFADACDGFNNPAWDAGKLPCDSVSKFGLDDIQFKIGYDFVRNDDNHASLYAVATAPTGKRPNSSTLFEPLVGSVHWSAGAGFNGDYTFYDNCCHSFNIMVDVKYRYVFSARERRSLDLNNGDWSRYLLVVTPEAPAFSLPAINLLTQPVWVIPGSTIDCWAALHYERCGFNVEIGYDFWWRQAEKLHRSCANSCSTESLGSFGIQTLELCSFPITSASGATISQSVVGSNATVTDATFTPINCSEINYCSAANPSAHSSTVYADIGYVFNQCGCRSWLLGLGGSYEIANKYALSQWAVWLTGGVAF